MTVTIMMPTSEGFVRRSDASLGPPRGGNSDLDFGEVHSDRDDLISGREDHNSGRIGDADEREDSSGLGRGRDS